MENTDSISSSSKSQPQHTGNNALIDKLENKVEYSEVKGIILDKHFNY